MSSSECASVEVVRLGRANSQSGCPAWLLQREADGRSWRESMHTPEHRLNNSLPQQIRTTLVNVPSREGRYGCQLCAPRRDAIAGKP